METNLKKVNMDFINILKNINSNVRLKEKNIKKIHLHIKKYKSKIIYNLINKNIINKFLREQDVIFIFNLIRKQI